MAKFITLDNLSAFAGAIKTALSAKADASSLGAAAGKNVTTSVVKNSESLVTSGAVHAYVTNAMGYASNYRGTATSTSSLPLDAMKGDYMRVSTAWSGVHVGDVLIAEKDKPQPTVDGTNWSLIHGEVDTWRPLGTGADDACAGNDSRVVNGQTAYGWGNHASAGYLKAVPAASSTVLGGIKLGYTASGKNYPVAVDSNNKAYVNVPWENTTYGAASQSAAGLMSANDKKKLDGIAEGANNYSLPANLDNLSGHMTVSTVPGPQGSVVTREYALNVALKVPGLTIGDDTVTIATDAECTALLN